MVSSKRNTVQKLLYLKFTIGVEDAATYQRLTAFGCALVQGYYISRPLLAVDFSTWLHESAWPAQAA